MILHTGGFAFGDIFTKSNLEKGRASRDYWNNKIKEDKDNISLPNDNDIDNTSLSKGEDKDKISLPSGNLSKDKDKDKDKSKDKDKDKDNLDFVETKFKPTFQKWLTYKKERKESYKGSISIRQCYNRLIELSGNDISIAEKIVNRSIANNWAGLFELKEKGGLNNGAIDYNGKDADKSKYDEFCKRNTKVFYNN